jgi:hypothetical protein
MKFHIRLFLVVFLILCQCSSPFDTEAVNPDDVFNLTVDFDSQYRIIESMQVHLAWSEITLAEYQKTKITRFNHHRDPDSYPVGTTNGGWITIAEFENEFVSTFTDTITDDAVFTYRVEYFNKDNNFKRAETEITIRPTTHLTIPDDMDSVKTTVESYIIDSGDSVLIKPGEYITHSFSFLERDLYLIGVGGALVTYLQMSPEVGSRNDSAFVDMTTSGTIIGFTIMHSQGKFGGGIRALGSAIVQQCIIHSNYATTNLDEDEGYGGGLYISGNALIRNCILYDNNSRELGDGIYVDEKTTGVQIVNCTLFNNGIVTNSSNLIIKNCIIAAPLPLEISSGTNNPTIQYTLTNPGLVYTDLDTTIITGDPLLSNPPNNMHLAPLSPCVDAGDPSSEYFDHDGSRNDMGAYGGPGGDWN